MKRASYRAGVEWIACNDNAGSEDPRVHDAETVLDAIAGYISTLLLADLFDVDPRRVAQDVIRRRTIYLNSMERTN